jgi:hypothetical protein
MYFVNIFPLNVSSLLENWPKKLKDYMKARLFNNHASFLVTSLRHDEPQGQEGDLKRKTTRLVDLKEKTF